MTQSPVDFVKVLQYHSMGNNLSVLVHMHIHSLSL